MSTPIETVGRPRLPNTIPSSAHFPLSRLKEQGLTVEDLVSRLFSINVQLTAVGISADTLYLCCHLSFPQIDVLRSLGFLVERRTLLMHTLVRKPDTSALTKEVLVTALTQVVNAVDAGVVMDYLVESRIGMSSTHALGPMVSHMTVWFLPLTQIVLGLVYDEKDASTEGHFQQLTLSNLDTLMAESFLGIANLDDAPQIIASELSFLRTAQQALFPFLDEIYNRWTDGYAQHLSNFVPSKTIARADEEAEVTKVTTADTPVIEEKTSVPVEPDKAQEPGEDYDTYGFPHLRAAAERKVSPSPHPEFDPEDIVSALNTAKAYITKADPSTTRGVKVRYKPARVYDAYRYEHRIGPQDETITIPRWLISAAAGGTIKLYPGAWYVCTNPYKEVPPVDVYTASEFQYLFDVVPE